MASVLISGVWRSGRVLPLGLGVAVSYENAARDAVLLATAVVSYLVTPSRLRIENAFTWVPIREVAILFAGIFVTIVPVLDALKAGQSATVIHLAASSAHGDGAAVADVSRRLMELGFVPGERIRMLKRGLPGGPVAVKVGQSTFALRRFEAALVSIQPE